MNKKAASVLLMIFEIIAVIVILSTLVGYALKLAKSDHNFKVITAEEFSMMINTLVAVPGEVVIEYPSSLGNFTLILDKNTKTKQNQISVYQAGQTKSMAATKSFILPQEYKATGAVTGVSKVCLIKKQNTINLEACQNQR